MARGSSLSRFGVGWSSRLASRGRRWRGLALHHGINANQLRRWMAVEQRLVRGEGVALLPVTTEASAATPVASTGVATPAGPIEIEVFGARLKLHGEVDPQRLRIVLDALARRP